MLEAIVRAKVAQIRVLNAEIAGLERQTAVVLAAHPKTALLTTLPRVANVSLAALIAEIGPLLDVRGHGKVPTGGQLRSPRVAS